MPLLGRPPVPERGEQVIDKIVAAPAHSRRTHLRSGPRQAEEGLGREPSYSGAFVGGIATTDSGAAHASYESHTAGQANGRGRRGSGQQIPAWAKDPEALDSFAGGTSGDPGAAVPFRGQIRVGAQNPRTLSPLTGLMRGERVGNVVVRKVAPKAMAGLSWPWLKALVFCLLMVMIKLRGCCG
jgi:hypothetical protein